MASINEPVPAAWPAPVAHRPVEAAVVLPGSKSMTARALVLAALAGQPGALLRPLRARDTSLMVDGLVTLGADISTVDQLRWSVRPAGDRVAARPVPAGPARIDVGLAGTVMRFLPPVAALASGTVTFDGDPWARQRPLAPILRALADLGVELEASPDGGLPVSIRGRGGVRGGDVAIDASGSSQFVSGLLLSAPSFRTGLRLRHIGPPVPSAPHLRMTVAMLRAAGAIVDDSQADQWAVEPGPLAGREWVIEPDLSGAAPFLAAALVTGGTVTVPGWPTSTTQPGDQLRAILTAMGGRAETGPDGVTVHGTGTIRGLDADLSDVSELTPVIAALAALGDRPSRLRGVAHIRAHETDRISALATELGRLGAEITEWDDGLEIRPRPLHGGLVQTYADHRMAHAAAVVGLAVPGVVLSDVACTAKTMPEFPDLWRSIIDGDSSETDPGATAAGGASVARTGGAS